MSLVRDQDAIEELVADGADEAFGDCVGPRRPNRGLDDLDVDGGQYRVECSSEAVDLAVEADDYARARDLTDMTVKDPWV